MSVRVLIWARAPETDPGGVEEAYHRISTALLGVPGLRGNELLREVGAGDRFVVMSEWESMAAFRAWETGPDHRDTTAPLRPFQDAGRGRAFALYEVAATYGAGAVPVPG